MLNNKEFMLGPNMQSTSVAGGGGSTSSNSSSVPLYRRQGITMGNGHNLNSTGNSSNSTGGHSMASSTPDNILATGSPNDILAGLTTGSSTLIEALIQDQQNQQNNATLQKLLYNNFNAAGLKHGDLDMFMGNNSFVNALADGVTNNFHGQNFQPTSNAGGSGSGGNNSVATAGGDSRNTTYAAVLSQGPQTQEVLQPHHQHHNYGHNALSGGMGNGLGGLGLTVGGTANGEAGEKDPFAAIRELGQGTNGFYNYFQ